MSSCITASFPGHEEWPGNEAKVYSIFNSGTRLSPLSTVHKMFQATYLSTNFYGGLHYNTTVQYIAPLCSLFLPFFSPLFPSLPFPTFPQYAYVPGTCLHGEVSLYWPPSLSLPFPPPVPLPSCLPSSSSPPPPSVYLCSRDNPAR